MKFRFILSLLCCIFSITSFAQPICGFDHIHQTRLTIDPQYANQVQLNEQKIQKIIPEKKSKSVHGFGTLSTAIIPVVVHVIHTGGAVGSIYNPSDADVQGAIDYLNKVYAADASVTSGSTNLGIQFVLAKRTPYCSATTGIERIDGSGIPNYVANGVNMNSTSGTNEINVKNLSRWDPNSYYNIWVVDKIDGNDGTNGQFIAGYAYFAGAPASLDGTVMLATQMKSGQKTLPHEMGHAFSLYHPFEGSPDKNTCPPNTNNDCNLDGDRVCDTDPIRFNQLNGVVDFTPRTGNNPCVNQSYTANTESNFMNYTTSYLLFTAGQSARVSAALGSLRASLANSLGSLSIDMAPACVSQINFEIGSSSVTEATTSVDNCRGYTDYSYRILSSGPQPAQAVTATLTLGGTAVRGTDYDITTNGSFTSPSLDIPFSTSSDETKSFTVRIYDDKAIELQKTISLAFTLSNTSTSIGNINPALTITLNDDDVAPVTYFSGSIALIKTPTTSGGSIVSCFSGDLHRHRVQYLYRKADLYNAGIVNAAVLTALKLQVTTKNSTKPFTGFTVSMCQVPTTTTTLGNFASTTGFTTVYSGNYTTTVGTNNIPFSTNFNWDGQSNIVINMCYDNGNTNSNFDELAFNADYGQYVAALSSGSGASSGCALPVGYVATSNPAITFDCSFGLFVESAISSDEEYLGANALVYFKDAAGKLLANIQNLSSFDYGCTKVEIDRAGTSANIFWHNTNDKKVAATTFKVTPTNANPNGQYKITLYYTKAEIDGWRSITAKNLSDADMRVVKISNHNISEVSPATPYVSDVQWAPFTKEDFGSDTAISATFNTGFSGFGIGAIDVTPLPVTLLSFTGKSQNDNVALNWATSTEINSSYFDVETSVDGTNFYKAGQVKSKGNSGLVQDYSFIHYSPVEGANYYRLKQVDLNGAFTYSNVIAVQFDNNKGQVISIYPSPVNNDLNITFSKREENVMLRVISIDGKVVETKQIGIAEGKTSLNVSSLVNGVYILQVRINNEWRHFKFVKQ
ncbi:zinc-dependent metalloprotease [Pinibacter soli]|uniref:Zinc-dependent metalloprotease n=1 Tax=Pinibacter soli TaxID=3044211 RepID=A0ABT6RHW3_9BACT|nr:zinc-dependent metalloprotease [Pinibacter soli]MDI3322166.1 zinc-dependent metalloprotease [Pinibacter soli]